jgi:hypothetical protein
MSIVPVSCCSMSDLALLGNNTLAAARGERRGLMTAVNRSLAVHGEQVASIYQRRRGGGGGAGSVRRSCRPRVLERA